MSHMNESCLIWMRHVTYEGVLSHMNESCHIWMRHVTYEGVLSHMNESCHIWMRHVTYECVMSHMNAACHESVMYEGVMSYMNESCLIQCECVTTFGLDQGFGYMSNVTYERGTQTGSNILFQSYLCSWALYRFQDFWTWLSARWIFFFSIHF